MHINIIKFITRRLVPLTTVFIPTTQFRISATFLSTYKVLIEVFRKKALHVLATTYNGKSACFED